MKKITILFFALLASNLISFAQNNWVQRTSISNPRYYSTAFAIDSTIYVGGGYDNTTHTEFYKYNPLTNAWSSIASITGARNAPTSFVIDGYAYVGTGFYQNQTSNPLSSFYKYDPSNNTWSSIANFPHGAQGGAGFSSGGKGYVATGHNGTNHTNELWEYDPTTNSWTQKTDFPGSFRGAAVAVTIGKNTYVGMGEDGTRFNDFYCYNSDSDTWHQITTYPASGYNGTKAFAANGKMYVGSGWDGTKDSNLFYEYDPATNSWTQKKNIPINFRSGVAVNVGTRGYMGSGATGTGPSLSSGWYMYEPLAKAIVIDSIGKTSFCKGESDSVYFSVTNISDISNNYNVEFSNDNFITSTTIGSIKANNEGKFKMAITIPTNIASSDSFQIRVAASSPSFKGAIYSTYIRIKPSSPSNIIASKDSICDGDSSNIYLVQRDPNTVLNWYKNNAMLNDTGVSIKVKSGGDYNIKVTNMYLCSSLSSVLKIKLNPTPNTSVFKTDSIACEGDSIQLMSVNNTQGDKYSWMMNNQTILNAYSSKFYAKQSGKYILNITNTYGCSLSSNENNITINPKPKADIYNAKDTACLGDSILLTSINNSNGDQYQWLLNSSNINNTNFKDLYARQTGNFSLKITNSSNCSDISTVKNIVFLQEAKPSITVSGNILISSSANNYQWFYNGNIIVNETLQAITPTKNGLYTVKSKNKFGCENTSDSYSVSNIIGFNSVHNTLGLNIYPNPASNICTFEFTNKSNSLYQLFIYNTLGQIVLKKTVNSSIATIDLSELSNGIYIVQISDNNQIITEQKLIKN